MALVCALTALSAGAEDDLVNERPPAGRAAMERHWGVDCAAAVSVLGKVLADRDPSPNDSRLDAVLGDIETCALLDRREAGPGKHYIPILDSLNAWRAAVDEAARSVALARLECQLDRHFDLHQGPEERGGL